MRKPQLAVLLLFALAACTKKDSNPPPLSPAEALKSFRLSDDFRIELFAAEPDVVDPVELAFDENGRVYVAEMRDYPEDPPPGKPALSRIRLLEDRDGDGRYERSTVFADHVLEVSGLMPWKGGLIVTTAPDIVFMKDTDGDGRADLRKVLWTGFPKVNPEGRITNPRLGVDNWIYCANSGADARVTSPDHPERPPLLLRGADFRFHPIRGFAEPASGPAQYGLTIDEFGNRFITQNTVHLRHVVVPMFYLARAPLLEVGAVATDISDHGRPSARMFPLTQPQAWRVERTRLRQHRYHEHGLNRTEHASGYFTAATGSTLYTGDVFPERFQGAIFTGDVSGNLVHVDLLHPDGVTFRASRHKDGVEFLASTDTWFRPCNFANAPDGNLYFADIYRLFIETPESIPEELKKKMDFWAGTDRGRIYRIVPNKPMCRRDLRVNLGQASLAELVNNLENTNGWHRQTAHRLLLERQDRAAVPALRELAAKSRMPQARVRALWLLEGLSALEPGDVAHALKDSHPGVRENALRLAEPFLDRLREPVLALRNDPEIRVRYQLAFTLGQMKDPRARAALADLAGEHAADPWFRTAILSSAAGSAPQFLELLMARGGSWQDPQFVSRLVQLIGAQHEPAAIARVLAALPRLKQPDAGLNGLAKGLKLAGIRNLRVPGADAALARFVHHPSDTVQRAGWEAARYFELRALTRQAAADALNAGLPVPRRTVAVRALRGAAYASAVPVIEKILSSLEPAELQIAAIDSLATFDEARVSSLLLAHWKSYSPEARRKAVDALLSKPAWVPVLLEALEQRQVETSAIDIALRPRLLEHSDRTIAGRARRLFQAETADRMKIVESYRDALKLTGDVARGKKVFEEQCARCHLPRRQGGRVGPDLSGISNKTKEELLTSMFNPSYAIEPRFTNYLVTTHDGVMYDGILANETPGAVTLRGGSEEGDQTILRKNIKEIRASSISLMPEDLEKSMSKQDVADVIAYLRGGL